VTKLNDRAFTSVVARQNQIDPVVESIQQLLKIASAPRNILRRIVWPSNTETGASARHQLHQPSRALW